MCYRYVIKVRQVANAPLFAVKEGKELCQVDVLQVAVCAAVCQQHLAGTSGDGRKSLVKPRKGPAHKCLRLMNCCFYAFVFVRIGLFWTQSSSVFPAFSRAAGSSSIVALIISSNVMIPQT